MKKIINLLFASYFSYNFIFNFNYITNQSILIQFIFYLIFDTFYIIKYDYDNKIRNDLILHHINTTCLSSSLYILCSNYNYSIKYYDILFSLQEFTTVIITLKNLLEKKSIKKYLNYLLNIIWIPLRLVLPYYSLIYTYLDYQNNIYFRLKILCATMSLLINLKWTFDFLKLNRNNKHFSSMILITPILFLKNDIILFNNLVLLSIFSYIYNIHKNIYTLALDTSFMTIICLKLCFNMNILYLVMFSILLFLIKIIVPKSEIHSLILIISYFKALIYNKYLLYFNLINIPCTYLHRHFTKITLLWHIGCALIILSVMFKNEQLIIY